MAGLQRHRGQRAVARRADAVLGVRRDARDRRTCTSTRRPRPSGWPASSCSRCRRPTASCRPSRSSRCSPARATSTRRRCASSRSPTRTELGTVYAIDELRALADVAHANGLLLHVDGSRLANAAVALGASLADDHHRHRRRRRLVRLTKNGALGVEAVVFLATPRPRALPGCASSTPSSSSKMRFLVGAGRRAARGRPLAPLGEPRQRDGRAAGRRGRRRSPGVRITRPSRPTRSSRSSARAVADAPARDFPLLHLGRGHRRGPLDVLVGHDRGRRAAVRGRAGARGRGGGSRRRRRPHPSGRCASIER